MRACVCVCVCVCADMQMWFDAPIYANGSHTQCCVHTHTYIQSGFGNNESNCWLSTDGDRVVWAFIGPMVLVCFINAIFFVRTLRVILSFPVGTPGSSNVGPGTKSQQAKRALKASVSFFALMGLTWTFGALAIGDSSLVFQYLFVVFNSFQGLVVFCRGLLEP